MVKGSVLSFNSTRKEIWAERKNKERGEVYLRWDRPVSRMVRAGDGLVTGGNLNATANQMGVRKKRWSRKDPKVSGKKQSMRR